MSSRPLPRNHALVIGSGIAGLLAARVLSDHFSRVTILERDRLPPDAAFRSGTPQARHGHGLLARGLNALNHLFTNFDADLDAAGVTYAEWMWDTRQLIPTGWTPHFHSGIISRPCSRQLIEHLIRQRIRAIPNISICEGVEVSGFITSGNRVTGITMKSREMRKRGLNETMTLEADLVVDASGRGSKAPGWLAEAGFSAPHEAVIDAGLGYATRLYRLNLTPDYKALLMLPRPDLPCGLAFHMVEDGAWILTAAGYGNARPPTDEVGFNGFLASLPLPPLHEALPHAQAISPIYGYGRTANRMRHYERLSHPPEGFIALGDAVCAFNPIYGQGMTVSALAAETLDRWLKQRGTTRQFQRALYRRNADAWLMATSEDLRFMDAPFDLMRSLERRYLDLLFSVAPRSQAVSQGLLETMHLLRHPYGLSKPDVLFPLISGLIRRAG
jgi:2-polyprenyl-6-methoxyphenol hydroxylase-like FAD-dependent oxidoreductase